MSDYFNLSDSNPGFTGFDNDTANQPWDLTLPAQQGMSSVHPFLGWEGMMAAAPTAPVVQQSSSYGTTGLGNAGTQTLHGQATGLPESLFCDEQGYFTCNAANSEECSCAQCHQVVPTPRSLEAHTKAAGHSAFLCQQCNKSFARHDSLQRHIASKHSTSYPVTRARFPCPVCYAYEGEKAFTRRDHLNQHLRGFHKFEAKGIAYFKVRGGTREVPASRPLNSAPALRQENTSELAGSLGQTDVLPMTGFGDGNMSNFESIPENFPGF